MDRNFYIFARQVCLTWSLSARRAWIEISYGALAGATEIVALRKESVDRNWWVEGDRFFYYASLSARRAWIEMQISVTTVVGVLGRSPQGERG